MTTPAITLSNTELLELCMVLDRDIKELWRLKLDAGHLEPILTKLGELKAVFPHNGWELRPYEPAGQEDDPRQDDIEELPGDSVIRIDPTYDDEFIEYIRAKYFPSAPTEEATNG